MYQNYKIEKLETKMLLDEMSESPNHALTVIERTVKEKTEAEKSDIGEGLWGNN